MHQSRRSLQAEGRGRHRRIIFIDALNLAYWCGAPPSLRIPLGLMNALVAGGHETFLYFDASARYLLAAESEIYTRLLQHAERVVEAGSGVPADRVLLRHATSRGACIVSRDHYRDHRRRYRKLIDDPDRLLPGAVSNDRIVVPSLALDVRLPASAEEAWDDFSSSADSLAGVDPQATTG